MLILALNPGSASLKFEVIEVSPAQTAACEGKKLASASIEGIGKSAKLLAFREREIASTQPVDVSNIFEGTRYALRWLTGAELGFRRDDIDLAVVRVVHGGTNYPGPVRLTDQVKRDIQELAELAPLHNVHSLEIASVLEREIPHIPIMAIFDTSFHRTIPEIAWRYPIERNVADRFGIRKFGFHGLSHRYMLEQYAFSAGKKPQDLSLITLHLESGSSATAISLGKSIDTTMGFTPLDGLMMGTRSGSIDPSIVAYLARHLHTDSEEVMALLNEKSGLIGIAAETYDTRELVKRTDREAQLALAMFSYRIRLAIGKYLAILDNPEAVLFGGGIGEDTPLVRQLACEGLNHLGIDLDKGCNSRVFAGPARITKLGSPVEVHVIPVEEGLEMAHESCMDWKSSE